MIETLIIYGQVYIIIGLFFALLLSDERVGKNFVVSNGKEAFAVTCLWPAIPVGVIVGIISRMRE